VQVGQGAVAGLGSLFGAALSAKTPSALKALYTKGKKADESEMQAASKGILVHSGPLQVQLNGLESLSEHCVQIVAGALGAAASAKLMAGASTACDTDLRKMPAQAVALLTEGLAALREALEPPAFRAALKRAVGDVDSTIVGDVAKALWKRSIPEDGIVEIAKVNLSPF
jgi:hypothetical protein